MTLFVVMSRSRAFSESYVCNECHNNAANYDINDNRIAFIDAFHKRYEISSDTEIDIVNPCNNNNIDVPDNVPISKDNYKDALLVSLYTQVEYLKTQISEKDLLIRTLLIKEQEYYTYNMNKEGEIIIERNEENCELNDVSLSENSESTSSGENLCDSIEIEDENNRENEGTELNSGDNNGDMIFFKHLYHQYKNDKKEKLETQLLVRRQKHNLYQGLLEELIKSKKAGKSYQNKEREKTIGTNYHYNKREMTHPHNLGRLTQF